MSIEKAYTTGQVSQYCQVSRATVLKWIRRELLDAYTIPGGYHRITRRALVDFMESYSIPVPTELATLEEAFEPGAARASVVN